jgi:hypothetical protein
MRRAEQTRVVSFRVPESEWQKMARMAEAAGAENVNDWCRNVALGRVTSGDPMTPNERFIFEELARVRYLVGHGFRLLAQDKLAAEEWQKIRDGAEQKAPEILEILRANRRARRQP